jgi:hypothetical protein
MHSDYNSNASGNGESDCPANKRLMIHSETKMQDSKHSAYPQHVDPVLPETPNPGSFTGSVGDSTI